MTFALSWEKLSNIESPIKIFLSNIKYPNFGNQYATLHIFFWKEDSTSQKTNEMLLYYLSILVKSWKVLLCLLFSKANLEAH
jgi:hypothetical protein